MHAFGILNSYICFFCFYQSPPGKKQQLWQTNTRSLVVVAVLSPWNVHRCVGSSFILYQLILPCLSALLSAGDASQNTIPLGESLRLSGFCRWLCIWQPPRQVVVFSERDGVHFCVQLLWYMMRDIMLSWWHLLLSMCVYISLTLLKNRGWTPQSLDTRSLNYTRVLCEHIL